MLERQSYAKVNGRVSKTGCGLKDLLGVRRLVGALARGGLWRRDVAEDLSGFLDSTRFLDLLHD
ncbi:MAG TPA: hypothetical protein VJU86_05905 [Pyrinomonadaceae bacterium]|nr:hypothetical protein [Pyrinomonadaceae bacterium]